MAGAAEQDGQALVVAGVHAVHLLCGGEGEVGERDTGIEGERGSLCESSTIAVATILQILICI